MMKFGSSFLVISSALTMTSVAADNLDCTLDCQNNGTCIKQWQTAARSTSNFVQVMACSCPEGFTGPLCEQLEDNVNEENEECTLNCVNGGQCLWEWSSADNGNYAFDKHMKCDCLEGFVGDLCEQASPTSNANNTTTTEMACHKECGTNGQCVIEWSSDATRSNHQFVSQEKCKCDVGYEGETCQQSTVEETPCAHTCHNGGKCVSKWETAPLANEAMIQVTGCECAPGFTGPSCEIELSEDDEDDKCHLTCQNGGQCVFTWMESFKSNYFNTIYQSSFMMCECPLGYMGLHCEYQVETCPDSTMCFNGGKCVEDETDPSSYSCDCSDASPNHEGSMCEQLTKSPDVEVCDYGHADGQHGQSLFCVNGGTCDTTGSHSDTYHHGCDCPDGFFGHHCEFHLDDSLMTARETTEQRTSSPARRQIIMIVVCSVVGTAFFGLAMIGVSRFFMGRHDEARAKMFESTSTVPSSVAEGDLDADGSGMTTMVASEGINVTSETSPKEAFEDVSIV